MKSVIIADMPMRVSLTIDIRSCSIFRSYFCVTSRCINPNRDTQSAVIGFLRFEIRHDGASVQTILIECLDESGILNTFTATTSDNSSKMVRVLDLLATHVELNGFYIGRMDHVSNLSVKAAFSKIQNSIESHRKTIRTIRISVEHRENFDN